MRIFLLLFLLSLRCNLGAAEFSASIPGTLATHYAAPLGDFIFPNDGSAELATRQGLFRLQANGTVERSLYPSQGAYGYLKYRLTFEGDSVELFESGGTWFPYVSWIRRVTPAGVVRFSGQLRSNYSSNYFPTTSASLKADGNGGFWLLWGIVQHVGASGEVTTLSNKSGSVILDISQNAIIFADSEMTRVQLNATPSPQQTTRIDNALRLLCMRSTDAEHWVAVAARYNGSGYTLVRLSLDSPGIVTSEQALQVVANYYDVSCSNERVAIRYEEGLRPRQKLLMLDTNYQEQWRANAGYYIRALTIGPDGQAAGYDLDSGLVRFSATGQVAELGSVSVYYEHRINFDASGALWITGVSPNSPVSHTEFLQVLRFPAAYNAQRPTQIYDLPVVSSTVEALASAFENGQIELLTRSGYGYGVSQSWRIGERGASLLYELPVSELSIGLAERLPGAWVISGSGPKLNRATITAKTSYGVTIFERQQEATLLSCNTSDCEYFGSGAVGRFNIAGQFSDLAVTDRAIQALYPAPGRRASLRADGRLGQILNGQAVFGPVFPQLGGEAVQLPDGKLWAQFYSSLYLTDSGGYPLFSRACDSCHYILDYHAKSAYEITAAANGTQLRRLQTDGNYSQAITVPLIELHSIIADGDLLWLRGQAESGPVVYALQLATGRAQTWRLTAGASPISKYDSTGPMQFVAHNALSTVESVTQGRDSSLVVRRFEFDSLLQDGFE